MKRSEMINEIDQYIKFRLMSRSLPITAEDILDTVEKLGMLPPKYQALMRDGTKYIAGQNEGDTICRHAWEPENE